MTNDRLKDIAFFVSLVIFIACTENSTSHQTQVADTSVTNMSDAGEGLLDMTMVSDIEPDASTPPEILYQRQSGETTLTLTRNPDALNLVRDGENLVQITRDHFLLGTVSEVDPTVNYDPFYIWSDVISANPADLMWLSPETWSIDEEDEKVTIELTYPSAHRATLEVSADAADRFKIQFNATSESGVAYLRIAKTVDTTEGFYGLGEVFDDVNHRGKIRAMQLEADIRIESTNNEAHVPIPLLLGSRGWGAFYHTFHPSVFGVANEQDDRVDFAVGLAESIDEGLTFYLFSEAHPIDLTQHYYALTGEVKLPADWAYGPLVWRDENRDQDQVLEDVAIMRDLDLAVSGIWIDRPYASGVNSFDFKAEDFPDPEGMVASLHAQGYRLSLWHNTYVGERQEATAALHEFAVENSFYPLVTGPILNPWGRPIDLTNPDAYSWWQDNLSYYQDLGIEGYKLDYVEDFVIGVNLVRFNWLFADGSTERTMHKWYQYLFEKVYAETLPESGGFLLCRSATIGSQALGAVIWPGDLDANFARHQQEMTDRDGRDYVAVGGLPAAVVASISLGPSGFPFFGSDTGGYRRPPPNKEVFMRWFQHTALSSVMQIGTNSNDVAWEFREENGFDQELLDNYRIFTRLHLRLFPYAWTYAHQINETGRPILRPYGLLRPEMNHHPSDLYFFGDDLLVAPVVAEGIRERSVMFPDGVWYDWWSGLTIEGPTEEMVSAPLDTLPLYVKAGAVIPMLRTNIDTLSPVAEVSDVESYANHAGRLTLRIFAGADHTLTLFDGTEIQHRVENGNWVISIQEGEVFTDGFQIELVGLEGAPTDVSLDGEPVQLQQGTPDHELDIQQRFTISVESGSHELRLSR